MNPRAFLFLFLFVSSLDTSSQDYQTCAAQGSEKYLCLETFVREHPESEDGWAEYGDVLYRDGKVEDAIFLMENRADYYLGTSSVPLYHAAVMSYNSGQYERSIKYMLKSLENPRIPSFEWANRTAPHYLGLAFGHLRRYEEALDWFERGGNLHPGGFNDYFSLKVRILNWNNWNQDTEKFQESLKSRPQFDPHMAAFLPVPPLLGKKAGEGWTRHYEPLRKLPVVKRESFQVSKRIKIGYTSSDFTHPHAAVYLMHGLFPNHDRRRFEIYLYSLKDWRVDPKKWVWKNDLPETVEHWVDLSNYSDQEAAVRIQEDGIDILMDLNGWMSDHRMGIYSFRPAPIQINYMACPTTLGAPYFDYVLSDLTSIPVETQQYYTEKILYVEDSYFITNHKNFVPDNLLRPDQDDSIYFPQDVRKAQFSYDPWEFWSLFDQRKEVIFCNFAKNLKQEPYSFKVWMELLKEIPNSKLLLLSFNQITGNTANENLQNEVLKAGVELNRVQFVNHLDPLEHSQRLKRCHVYLDNFVYGAHTLAVDSLWAGTPLVALEGIKWSQRVGLSILKNLGLDELLVAKNVTDYKNKVHALVKNRTNLTNLRKTIYAMKHREGSIFDLPSQIRKLERALEKVWRRYASGLPLTHLYPHREPSFFQLDINVK